MKHQHRGRLIGALTASLIAASALLSAPALAQGQDYPTKTIRIVVPFAPGGGNDILARLIAPRLSESLGKPVIVDNRPGAGGNIGTEMVARAAPDGYTILMASNQVTINSMPSCHSISNAISRRSAWSLRCPSFSSRIPDSRSRRCRNS
jgi:tripartite-type tricarboxylate transporter receptor subunit TctC